MKTFTKLILLLAVELGIFALLLNFSRASQLAMTVFFPPLIAVTLYFFVLLTFRTEHKTINKQDLIFAILLASVALFSTSVGYHFASNDIDVALERSIKQAPVLSDMVTTLQDRLYFLDEDFSHWIMLAGGVGITLSFFLWWYFNRYKKGKVIEKQEKSTEQTVLDLVIVSFGGCFLGGIMSFAMIEAQVSFYAVIILSLILPILIYRWRTYKLSLETFRGALLFVSFMATIFAINLAWLIVRKAGFLIHF